MAATKYTFSIQADFPNHAVATDRLQQEIAASAIVTALDHVDTVGDACDVWFKAALDAGDEAALDALVAVHSGEPLPGEPAQVVLTSLSGAPVDIANNRMLVVPFPADFGANLWLTGCGDDVANGVRGGGPALAFTFADVQRSTPETQSVEVQFLEQVQLHDGSLFVSNPGGWAVGDEWSFGAVLPATVVTPNGGGTGNCNLVPLPAGNLIVPAAGDGAYDVDLATAVPVPGAGGFWDYDYVTDVLAVSSAPGAAGFHLLDTEQVAYVQRRVPVPFNPTGEFNFDAYDAQRIAVRWKLRLSVKKASNGPGQVAGWIVVFRAGVS